MSEFDELHSGLTVNLISTRKKDFVFCKKQDNLGAIVEANTEKFDFQPVVEVDARGRQNVAGIVHLAEYYDRPAPNGLVEHFYIPLREEHLIGADSTILAFILDADTRPFRLVVSDSGIVGLVSLSDLQKLAVRATLFSLVTGLEIAMTQIILMKDPDERLWRNHLSVKRRKALDERINEARASGGIVSELLFTQFADKRDILAKSVWKTRADRKRLVRILKRVEDLRNNLAHANDYAVSNEDAASVCQTARDILETKKLLTSG